MDGKEKDFLDKIRTDIEQGGDINRLVDDRYAYLHTAIENNWYEAAEYIIEKGADLTVQDVCSNTPLYTAVKNGRENIIKLFINNGVDLCAKNYDGETAFHEAASHGNYNIVNIFLEAGVAADYKTDYGETALFYAAKGCEDVPDSGDEDIYLNHKKVAEILVTAGADVNAKNKGGNTALHYLNNKPVAEVLVANGASVAAVNNEGRTPLHHIQKSAVAKYLLTKGADVNAKVEEVNETPLHEIAIHGPVETLKVFIEHGADVHALDWFGATPLHEAAFGNNAEEKIKCLLEHGADINALDEYGNPILYKAVHFNKVGNAKVLLENGADININYKKEDGKSLLDHAVFNQHEEMAELLRSYGAKREFVYTKSQEKKIIKKVFKAVDSMAKKYAVAEVSECDNPDGEIRSWIGKVDVARKGETWPMHEGKPMLPFIQIRVDQLPYVPPQFKGLALITVFFSGDFDNFDEERNGQGWELRTYEDLNELVPLAQEEIKMTFKVYLIKWVLEKKDYPLFLVADYPVDMNEFVEIGARSKYEERYNCHHLTKVGGWAYTYQGSFCEEDQFVFQVCSCLFECEELGDFGMMYFYKTGSQWCMNNQCT